MIEIIFDGKQKGFCLSISTGDADAKKAQKMKDLGLLTHHVYAIINAAEVRDA